MKKTFMEIMNPRIDELENPTIMGLWWAMLWRFYAWLAMVAIFFGIIGKLLE